MCYALSELVRVIDKPEGVMIFAHSSESACRQLRLQTIISNLELKASSLRALSALTDYHQVCQFHSNLG